ncbi:hypothetical protein OE88DRAFT_1646231 [Heliocybe sulcata]|uniref:Uncharacterized protein n=1 Tax=Heliocybe sulcata TaxID=5364 RepID=A0A5C3MX22_9AGAM|nr:hypothetical protein OE88DRAFT_1646231 [Heliocybe sulcata]
MSKSLDVPCHVNRTAVPHVKGTLLRENSRTNMSAYSLLAGTNEYGDRTARLCRMPKTLLWGRGCEGGGEHQEAEEGARRDEGPLNQTEWESARPAIKLAVDVWENNVAMENNNKPSEHVSQVEEAYLIQRPAVDIELVGPRVCLASTTVHDCKCTAASFQTHVTETWLSNSLPNYVCVRLSSISSDRTAVDAARHEARTVPNGQGIGKQDRGEKELVVVGSDRLGFASVPRQKSIGRLYHGGWELASEKKKSISGMRHCAWMASHNIAWGLKILFLSFPSLVSTFMLSSQPHALLFPTARLATYKGNIFEHQASKLAAGLAGLATDTAIRELCRPSVIQRRWMSREIEQQDGAGCGRLYWAHRDAKKPREGHNGKKGHARAATKRAMDVWEVSGVTAFFA